MKFPILLICALPGFAQIVDGDDARVIESRQRVRFTQEADAQLRRR